MIKVENLCKSFRTEEVETIALNNVSFKVNDGEFVAVMGPSGCGKSTLLNILGLLDNPTSGKYWIGDREVASLKEKDRTEVRKGEIGFVFQSFNLIDELNVAENIELPLTYMGVPKAERRQRVKEIMARMNISHRAGHFPHQLSGGQQQRVALARALVIEPSVLLFDEPLSNLDAKLRVSMRTEIRRIQQEVGITAIYVTHDQSEAMALSDKIIIMNKGVVAQMGTPQEIYYHPVNEFVADFIGEANFLKGKMTGKDAGHAVLDIEGNALPVEDNGKMEAGGEYTLVLRPEAASLADEGGLPCEVVLSCFMGSYQNYHVKVGDTLVKLEEHNPKNKHIYAVGDHCSLVFDPRSVHVL